jgi:hypothetical protein
VRAQLAAAARFAARRTGAAVDVERGGGRGAGELGIARCIDRRPRTLSGGELRRAEVALAFAVRPTCFLATSRTAASRPWTPSIWRAPSGGSRPPAARWSSPATRSTRCSPAPTACCGARPGTTHELGTPDEALAHFQFRREYLGPRR